jgi:hypothetical protein
MLMSTLAISSALAGLPNFGGGGVAAKEALAKAATTKPAIRARSDIDIAHLAEASTAQL